MEREAKEILELRENAWLSHVCHRSTDLRHYSASSIFNLGRVCTTKTPLHFLSYPAGSPRRPYPTTPNRKEDRSPSAGRNGLPEPATSSHASSASCISRDMVPSSAHPPHPCPCRGYKWPGTLKLVARPEWLRSERRTERRRRKVASCPSPREYFRGF